MKQMLINFSGTCYIAPENVKFQYIGEDEKPSLIDGNEWLKLNEDEQSEYIFESIIDILTLANEVDPCDFSFDGLDE